MNLGQSMDRDRLKAMGPWVVIAVAAVVTLLVLVRGGGYLLAAATGQLDDAAALQVEVESDAPDANERIAPVRDRNLFAPVERNEFGGRLVGVLGNRALFNGGQSARVGERAHGAEVVEIGATWATVSFDGEEKRLEVFDGPRRSAGGRRGGPRRAEAGAERGGRGGGPPRMRRGGGDIQIPPGAIGRFRNLPPEQREQLLQRMPEHIRERIQEAD